MPGKKIQIILFSSIFLFYMTANAFADAGTALMWASMFHLVFGNAIIGILEGLLIAKIFSVKKIRAVSIMILANYASCAIGVLIIFGGMEHFVIDYIDLYFVKSFLIVLFIFSYLMTIYIEWPFCLWIFKYRPELKGKSFRASFYAQTFSYILLTPCYLFVSSTSLLWNVKLDKSLSFVESKAWVYYIAPNNKEIDRIHLDGTSLEKIMDVDVHSAYARLFVSSSRQVKGKWDLELIDQLKNGHDDVKELMTDFAKHVEPVRNGGDGSLFDAQKEIASAGVSDFRAVDQRDWKVSTGDWADVGIYAENKRTGQKFIIALETPFMAWYMRYASILPGDQVVFQIGDNQIAVLDLRSRKMGLIVKGRGPVVVLND